MILAFLLAGLGFLTLMAILAPLLRGSRPGAERASFDQAVYRDQLQELDRDIERGLLTPEEAAATRLEVQRRILAADRLLARPAVPHPSVACPSGARPPVAYPLAAPALGTNVPVTPPPATTPSPPERPVADRIGTTPLPAKPLGTPPPLPASTASYLARSPRLASALFVIAAAGSLAVYLSLGAPGVPDEPFATRQAEVAAAKGGQRLTLEQATDQLAAKLKASPADAQGWLLYARSLAMLSRWNLAEDAYRHAMDLGDTRPEVIADHAEMLVLAAGGTVTPAAEAAFRQILTDDSGNGTARYYLAAAASQAGEPRRAIDMLQALLADMPAESPLRAQVGQRIAEAAQAAYIPVPELARGAAPAPGPDASAVASAAGMPEAQRQAMIQGMVARLAAKQQADPANLDGWLQLGRAYAVLHEPDQAADAYDKAASLRPGDLSIPLQAARALLAEHKLADRLPPRVVDLLKRVEASDPQQPIVLWFLGLAATQDKHLDEARRYWGALLAKLPPAGDDARMVQAALDALPSQAPAQGTSTGVGAHGDSAR